MLYIYIYIYIYFIDDTSHTKQCIRPSPTLTMKPCDHIIFVRFLKKKKLYSYVSDFF